MLVLNALHSVDNPEILKFPKCWVLADPVSSARDKGAFVLGAVCKIFVLISLQLFRTASYSYLDYLSRVLNEQDCPSQKPCVVKEQ